MVNPERVFVVHGRNSDARDSMFTFLRAIGLKPMEWDQAVTLTGKGSPYIGEVLDVAFDDGQAVVVLMTPDDVAYIRSEYASNEDDPELSPRGQARPNVLFEAGMAMGRNADRTILVEMGDLRPFSDVGGRHVVRLSPAPETRKSLAERLRSAGCPVDLSGTDWMSAGDFTPPAKPGGGLPVGKKIPSRDRSGPHVDGHWSASGGNKLDRIIVTNDGAVPLFDTQVIVPESLQNHVHVSESTPVTRLPVGKSFTVSGWSDTRTMNGDGPSQFDLEVIGRLEDGSEFRQDVYFDAGS